MWNNKGHEFDEYAKMWNSEQKYVLYGAGNLGKEFFNKFREKINIIGFIDSDIRKLGTIFCGQDVKRLEEYNNCKIIVTSRFYKEIKDMLLKKGLQEDIDFTYEQRFESIFIFYNENRLVFREFDISITSFCTLNCKHCNMQMCKFSKKEHFNIENIKREADIYFKWVDYVQYLGILGGEPFLHPQLLEIVCYIAQNYRERIGKLEILTNGTCIPSDYFWSICHKHRISIQLSDYSVGLPSIKEKVEKFIVLMDKNKISYQILKYDNWLDFGLTSELTDSEETLKYKFVNCNNPWRSVYQDKFYYCHLQTSAYRAGLSKVFLEDVFDLKNYSNNKKIELLEFDQKKNEKGYLSFCKFCLGCSAVNDKYVLPAVQK